MGNESEQQFFDDLFGDLLETKYLFCYVCNKKIVRKDYKELVQIYFGDNLPFHVCICAEHLAKHKQLMPGVINVINIAPLF